MPRKINLHAPLRVIPIGDRTHRVKLLRRTQTPPQAGETDFGVDFDEVDRLWCDVRTKNGVFFFDGVAPNEGGDIPVTHELWMEFYPGVVDDQSWCELDDGTRLRVLFVDDLEQRHISHRLICTARGHETRAAATS